MKAHKLKQILKGVPDDYDVYLCYIEVDDYYNKNYYTERAITDIEVDHGSKTVGINNTSAKEW